MSEQARCFFSQKNASERSSHSDTSGQLDQQKLDFCCTFALEFRDTLSDILDTLKASTIPNKTYLFTQKTPYLLWLVMKRMTY